MSKRGKHVGVSKVSGEFDRDRLIEGDAVADHPPEDVERLRRLKWALRGNLREMVRKATSSWKGELGVALAGDVDWLLERVEAVALGRTPPEAAMTWLKAMADIEGQHKDPLALPFTIAMQVQGDIATRRIYCTPAELKHWVHRKFPEALRGAVSDGGRSRIFQSLRRQGITCAPMTTGERAASPHRASQSSRTVGGTKGSSLRKRSKR